MKYLGKVELGGLYFDNQTLKIPINPHDNSKEVFNGSGIGDVYTFEKNKYRIGSTPVENDKKLKWHKFKSDNNTIYICDRVLVNNLSYDDIQEWMSNNYVYIDNKKYIQRTMTQSEWELLVLNNDNVNGIVSLSKVPKTINKNVKNNNHNQFWNWIGIGTYTKNNDGVVAAGGKSPENLMQVNSTYSSSDVGFRPVLEEVHNKPIITGEEGRLGEYPEPFNYEYSTESYLDNDTLRVVESIDNTPINEYTTQGSLTNSSIDMSQHWNDLPTGSHRITVQATNSENQVSTKTALFNTPVSTFVHKEGLDYFATQLWNTKIKPLMEDFSKKVGGLVLDSNWPTCIGNKVLHPTNLSDNGNALRCNILTTESHIITFVTNTLKLGKYAIGVRAMSSINTSTNCFKIDVVKVAGATRTTIATKTFKDSDFGNTAYNINYLMFDYGGSKVDGQTVEFVVTGISSTNHVLYLDYVLISPVLPAVFY